EILHPHGVQLVQSGERSGVAPPQARHALHQTLVLFGLGEAAEAGELVGHETQIYGVGEVGGGWGGWGGLGEVAEVVEVVEVLSSQRTVELPGEKAGAVLAVVQGRPLCVG